MPMTPLGAVVRGLASGAAGTLAMDLVQYARYRRRGGRQPFRQWEFSAHVESWDEAPAPAQIGKRLLEGVFRREVPVERAPLVNNVMHWAYGTAWGVQYGIVAGSAREPRTGWGIALGTTVWASDYVIMPLAGLYKPVWEYDAKVLARDLAAHCVYGLGTAATFRLLRSRERCSG